MQLVKIIRESLGLNSTGMSIAMQKNNLPAYIKLERTNTKITTVDLIRLQDISGLAPSDFWDLLVAASEEKKTTKRSRLGVSARPKSR